MIRNAGAFLVLGEAGELLSTVGDIAGDEWFTDADHRLLGFMPFGRVTRYATCSGAVYVADGTNAPVRRISVPSRTEQLLRLPDAQAVARSTPSQVREYKARRLADAGTIPSNTRIKAVSGDYIFALETDEWGTKTLVRLPLRRQAR